MKPTHKRLVFAFDPGCWWQQEYAEGLALHGTTDTHAWWALPLTNPDRELLQSAELVVFASFAAYQGARAYWRDCLRRVVTFEGMHDATAESHELDGIIIRDNRIAPAAMVHGVPVLYAPYRTQAFGPRKRRPTEGDLIVAVEGEQPEPVEGISFVTAAPDDAEEMDLLCVNLPDTAPTPPLLLKLAVAGVPAISSVCGEEWQLATCTYPFGSAQRRRASLLAALELGRDALAAHGESFAHWARRRWSWQVTGEAQRVTFAMEALCRG